MPFSDVIVIGGGPAGLTTAGALKQAGIEATILDSGERIGQSWEQRYDRLHLHTARAYSGLAYFPIPRGYPKYLSRDQYAGYLREYAGHFHLNFVPNTRVKRVRKAEFNARPGWAAETESETWQARIMVIATGQFNQPILPDWPGLSQYGGITLHSSKFRTGRAFQGQRVLVIGCGNSGMEIAADLVEQGAARVILSIRSGSPVVPREFLGVPVQLYSILLYPVPPAVSDTISRIVSRVTLGDLCRLGLPAPGWMPFSSRRTPVIDAGCVPALRAGKVSVRPAVHSFTPSGVIYLDQREEDFDAVIFATGFKTGLEQLLEPAGLVDENGIPRFPSGAAMGCPGLSFIGYSNGLRGLLYESNLASRRLAVEIQRYLAAG